MTSHNKFYDELLEFELRPSKADCYVFFQAKRGQMATATALKSKKLPTPFPESVNPADGDNEAVLSSRMIQGLILGGYLTSKGLRLYGFTFAETLDLRHVRTRSNISFEKCFFPRGIDIRSSELGNLQLEYCHANAFIAIGAKLYGNLTVNFSHVGPNAKLSEPLKIGGTREHQASICRFDCREINIEGNLNLVGSIVEGAIVDEVQEDKITFRIRELHSSLALDRAQIGGAANITNTNLIGQLSLSGADIGAAFYLRDSVLIEQAQPQVEFRLHSVFADSLKVGRQIHFEALHQFDRCIAPIRLGRSVVRGSAIFKSVALCENQIDRPALQLRNTLIEGDLTVSGKNFVRAENGAATAFSRTSVGFFDLRGSQVSGSVLIEGFDFVELPKAAINLGYHNCGRGLRIRDVTTRNQILAEHIHVGDSFSLTSVELTSIFREDQTSQQECFSARESFIGLDFEVSGKSTFDGQVALDNSRIGRSARIFNTAIKRMRGDNALSFQHATIGSDLSLSMSIGTASGSYETLIEGGVNLNFVRCESIVFARGSRIDPPIDKKTAVRCEDAVVRKNLDLVGCRFGHEDHQSTISLAGTLCHKFMSSPETWKHVEALNVGAFEYEKIDFPGGMNAGETRKLLFKMKSAGYDPTKYKFMSEALGRAGYPGIAKTVAIQSEKKRPITTLLDIPRAAINAVYGALTGYGYSVSRAGVWLLIFIGVLSIASSIAWRSGAVVPSQAVILQSSEWRDCLKSNPVQTSECWLDSEGAGGHHGAFSPVVYAIDVIVPLVSLGQEERWNSDVSRPKAVVEIGLPGIRQKLPLQSGAIMWWLEIFFSALGWVLSAAVAAAFSRPNIY